jgi:60 kDa SS-A/Ro ribonucleoprotein
VHSLSAAVGSNLQSVSSIVPRGKWQELDRYLRLGAGAGVYYAGEPKFSAEDAQALRDCLAENGARVVNAIVETAGAGRAVRHDSLLFALAIAASPKYASAEVNAAALDALPVVALSATHLRKFASYVTAHRGWGRSLRSAFSSWYLQMPVRDLAQQMLKQRRRSRWSHADLLRMAHPKPENKAQSILFRWAVEGELGRVPNDLLSGDLKQIYGFELAKKAADKQELVELIEAYQLTYEMIPDRWLTSAAVWEALLDGMPYCALLRNLGKLTASGLIAPQGEITALVAARLVDHRRIARSKANPVTLLKALLGFRSKHDVPAIASALETAFHASFTNIGACGCRLALILDGQAGPPSALMAMLMARTEPSATIVSANITREDRFDAVLNAVKPLQPHLDACPDAQALVVVLSQPGWTPPVLKAGVPLIIVLPDTAQPDPAFAEDPAVLQIIGFDETVPRAIAAFVH